MNSQNNEYSKILNQMYKQTKIFNIIKTRKLKYFGQVMHNENYHIISMQLLIDGKIKIK